jgi:enoyl-CoA hydratase/carnithine racemase
MRYMLTGDHWTGEEGFRMGVVQQIASTRDNALEASINIAEKIAACGPLGIKTTLTSAHLATDSSAVEALSKLNARYGALCRTEDSRKAGRQKLRVVRRSTGASDSAGGMFLQGNEGVSGVVDRLG